MVERPPWKRPAPGHMGPEQILAYLGNFGEVYVLRNGIAYRVDRMGETQPGIWIVRMTDRDGRQSNEYLIRGEMWYVTRRDLINWPDAPPRSTPGEKI